MKRLTNKLICSLFLVATVFPTVAAAQEAEEEKAPNLASVWVASLKTGKLDEFMAATAEHMAFRKAQGDSRAWQTFQPVIGDDLSTIVFRYCCFDWADEDAYIAETIEKGFDEHWNANVDPFVESYAHYLSYVDFENSHWDDETGPFTYFGVTYWHVQPGKYDDFKAAKAELSKMAKEHNWAGGERYWAWLSRIGGKSQESIVVPFKNFAGMAPPEQTFYDFAVETMGQEEAEALFAKFSESYKGSKYTVWRLIPELSMSKDEE